VFDTSSVLIQIESLISGVTKVLSYGGKLR